MEVWKFYFLHGKWEITNLLLFLFCCLPKYMLSFFPKIYTINYMLKTISVDSSSRTRRRNRSSTIFFHIKQTKIYDISITNKEFNECWYMVIPNSMLNEISNEPVRYAALLRVNSSEGKKKQ